jgi:hypothetical protein
LRIKIPQAREAAEPFVSRLFRNGCVAVDRKLQLIGCRALLAWKDAL